MLFTLVPPLKILPSDLALVRLWGPRGTAYSCCCSGITVIDCIAEDLVDDQSDGDEQCHCNCILRQLSTTFVSEKLLEGFDSFHGLLHEHREIEGGPSQRSPVDKKNYGV